jgi:hypothetical protein
MDSEIRKKRTLVKRRNSNPRNADVTKIEPEASAIRAPMKKYTDNCLLGKISEWEPFSKRTPIKATILKTRYA